jgi:hypothetical protein
LLAPVTWVGHFKGRGRLQQQVRRAFVAAGVSELTSSAIYDWTNARDRKMSTRRRVK